MNTFLKKLEVQGFKSFATKIEFNFPARITGIVGPNGSGKSNIVDAIRWVLGERAAKHLRGETLGNLLFAGTPKRPASSLARVSLHFKNKGNLFPVETAEAVLERKVDRSGASSFYINSAETRLRDLHPILARARLGTRGMTIIGQGQSDLFVRSTPEERRLMLEEILGLKEYRLKKNEAERKLAASEQNKEKAEAMAKEIEPHLKFLKKQRERWGKRESVEKELHELENTYFSHHTHSYKKEQVQIERAKKPLLEEKRGIEHTIQALQKKLKEFEKEHYEKTKQASSPLGALLQKKSEVERGIGRIEAHLALKQEEEVHTFNVKELESYSKVLLEELKHAERETNLDTLKRKIQSWTKAIEKIFHGDVMSERRRREEEKEIKGKLERLTKTLENIEKDIEKVRAEEEGAADKHQKIGKDFRDQIEGIEKEKDKLQKTERKLQNFELEEQRVRIRQEELEHQWTTFERKKEELQNLPQTNSSKTKEEWQKAEKQMLRLRSELASIGEVDKDAIQEAEETEERHTFLLKELGDLEKTIQNLKKAITDLDTRIHNEFKTSFKKINTAFNTYFGIMFGGGKAELYLERPKKVEVEDEGNGEAEEQNESAAGVSFRINIPRKKIKSLEMLSGGEKSLVSLAALFSLISISPPPFLVLDEIDAALDDENARRFSELVKKSSETTQFIIITHNRITMEQADVLYGVTMGDDGVSKVLSLKLEQAEELANA